MVQFNLIVIQEAIESESFFNPNGSIISKGNVDKELKSATYVLEGEIRVGGQEHFYLETQCALVVPKEDDEL